MPSGIFSQHGPERLSHLPLGFRYGSATVRQIQFSLMKYRALIFVAGLLATALTSFAADPFITEFMPANARILADEDGQFPDWIEIHNPAASPTNLQGWFLTDNPAAPTKWAFPSNTLPAGGYLVVFASGKNRTADPAHLHTSFQLNAEGGFLALVRPDGSNAASSYIYPKVKEDVSFGTAQSLIATSLVADSVPQILAPTNASDLPAGWNQPAFAAGSGWTNGVVPPAIGFDTNQATGVPSNVAPSGAAAQSTLNGAYVAANAINGNLGDFTHTLGTDSAPFWQVTLTNEVAIYSVALHNRTSCCGSRLRDITIEILSTNLTGTVTNFSSALLNPENTGFTYPAGPAFLSNNLVSITGGPVSGRIVRVRRTIDPDLSGSGGQGDANEAVVLSLGEVVITASAASGLRSYFTTDVQTLMFNRHASAFVRLPFALTNAPDLLALNLRYDDGFVAYVNGVEVARRNAPALPAWDSAATAERNLAAAIAVESIDVSAGIPALVSGTNVFAVQLLNASAHNADLLCQPELIATRSVNTTNVFLADATPGTRNNTGWYFDEVADTHFSVDRGFFEAPFSLSITSSTPGAVIYYSFNADEPAPGKGVPFTGPIPITHTTVLRARAFKEGWKATDVDTATYLFLGDVIYQAANWQQTRVPPQYFPSSWGANTVDYGMDPNVVTNFTLAQWREALTQIPTMSIVTEMPNLFDATTGIYANASGHGELWERPASLELIEPTNAVPGRFQENCGLRIRGGYSRNPQFVRHAFRIFFRREYGAGKLNYPLFGDEGASEFETFDLRNSSNYAWWRESTGGANDTFVREVWCRETLGALGQPYRRSRYYHLYLNGHYWGITETDERPESSYGETYFGGSKTNYDVVKCGNHSGGFATEATDGNFVAWSNLWTRCLSMLTNSSSSNYFHILGCHPDGTRNPALPVLLDVDNLIDYMLGIFYTGDGDATLSDFLHNPQRPNNWFGMKDRTNPNVGFRFFNSDCEHTLGAPSSRVDRTGPFWNAADSSVGNFTYSNPQYLHEELMFNAEYRLRFADHVQKHFFNGGALTFEQCTNRWWRRANQITKAIRAYSARWGDSVREPPYTESDWTNALHWVATQWFPTRADIVLAQLKADALYPASLGAPNFGQFGGAVSAGFSLELAHTNGSGVVYYTIDGSDPRAVGGGVAGTARAYSLPIPINTPMVVRARVLTAGIWSALVEYPFHPPQDLSKLLVTEIMYHPPMEGLVDGDEFEFLELKNAGATPLNLGGFWFSSGINFAFTNGTILAPGQFFVLTRNPEQFASRHPGVTVKGVYSGKLDNGGEPITLSHALGGKVLSVTYDDLAPWPVAPDGFGFSLVPMNPNANADLDNAANWRASALPGGSPGADDSADVIAPLLINEVLSHSETGVDFIELLNPTTNSVSIGGWFLTDDPGAPMKYRFPDNAMIGPISHLVLNEADFNPTPGTNGSFSLNGRGDDVYLFSGDANTNLTGYSHGFAFGAATDGMTFGRYLISTGAEQFPAQIAGTPGQPNTGPKVGPVVITEVMYHPDAGGDEFIELKNISANPVTLFDPAHDTNTWRLDGLGFTFPPNLTIGPGELLLITVADPVTFRAKYHVSSGLQIIGPSGGNLQDSGERLELKRPDVPDTNGVAYVTVDEVRYNDKAPWPAAADGSGPSLQRKNASAYGNDPANWDAAVATPGTGFLGGQSPALLTQPQNRTTTIGASVTFSVSADGPAPLNFQWRFNGTPIQGGTGSTLVLSNIQLASAGDYSVVVFNNSGSAASSIAQLTVNQPPRFGAQPADQFVKPSSNAVFSANVLGNGFLRYQWRFNGVAIAGATNSTFVVTNAQFTNEGTYTVAVTDSIAPAVSAPARLAILVEPLILQAPLSQTVVVGASVTISVTVTNTATLPIGYRLRRNNASQPEFYAANERSGFFTITNVQLPFTNYAIIVTNAARSGGILSASAFLTFLTDTDGDGLPDAWEATYGFATNSVSDRDLDGDGDGMGNWQEYVAGTDPTNVSSYLKIDSLLLSHGAWMEFGGVSNKTYTIQYRDDLAAGGWLRLTNFAARPTNRVERILDPTAATNRFYRVATPRLP